MRKIILSVLLLFLSVCVSAQENSLSNKMALNDTVNAVIIDYVDTNVHAIIEDEFAFWRIPVMIYDYIFLSKEDKQKELEGKFREKLSAEKLETLINEKITLYNEGCKNPNDKVQNVQLDDIDGVIDEQLSQDIQERLALELGDWAFDILIGLIIMWIISYFIGNWLAAKIQNALFMEQLGHKIIDKKASGAWGEFFHMGVSILSGGYQERQRMKAKRRKRRIKIVLDILLLVGCYLLFTNRAMAVEQNLSDSLIGKYAEYLSEQNIAGQILKEYSVKAKPKVGTMADIDTNLLEIDDVTLPEHSLEIKVGEVCFYMQPINGGWYNKGASPKRYNLDEWDEKEHPVHRVGISSFYMNRYEVTNELWNAIMDTNPSVFKDAKLPVQNVSWSAVQEFIKKLNLETGRHFRLPTDAEWEFAAKGGIYSKEYRYAGSNDLDEIAWCKMNSGDTPHEVGTKKPNELGLYDMSGNVVEWCSDWYGELEDQTVADPQGPSSGLYRVGHGGAWKADINFCRPNVRLYDQPTAYYDYLGFRLALNKH